ncbi:MULTISPECIES: dCTP deaminase [unclassified Pseudomonas]|jgi:dCTP deaminase|uniref:dCTP deaminase n=1 Tax=unclassified Pseudomonas TaxID=196821 RepID=UPI00132020CA|nr:dCTP deaminase [Pseudomonas sp. R84]QHC96692.1 hypothetical protein PspR84_19285 [Pseudomonas sp. R84]
MSVWSDTDILNGHNGEDLQIVDFNPDCLRSSSYLLRLHDRMLVRQSTAVTIDSRSTDTAALFTEVQIPPEGYVLEPGVLYLASSVERLRLGNNVCAEMGLLSCYARIGMNLNFGSNFIAATFGEREPSRLTLEIINLSRDNIRLYPGVKLCHLRVHQQRSPSRTTYSGIYAAGEQTLPTNFNLKPAR